MSAGKADIPVLQKWVQGNQMEPRWSLLSWFNKNNMEEAIKRENHIIDATDKVVGKLATQVAVLLRGKGKVGFAPYKDIGDYVVIKNADKMKFTGKKFDI